MRLLINFLAFQAGWFSCVLGAANGMPWLGPLVCVGVVTIHLLLVKQPARELLLIAVAVLMGLVFDSLLVITGVVQYETGLWAQGLAPYWILTLWVLFATTLNISMRWMKKRYWLAAAFGAIGGPLSYLAGQKLGAVQFADSTTAVIALAIIWAIAMPALMWLSTLYDGTQDKAAPDSTLLLAGH